jgi:hypothetical protein
LLNELLLLITSVQLDLFLNEPFSGKRDCG